MADSLPCYEAFISYRHASADTATAKRIQRALEGFRIPKALRQGARCSLGKLFRDADELPASASLTDEISRALCDSGYLIVICSPDTPSSNWVDLEIEEFLTTHGPDRILAVLVAGEPEQSFPAALLNQTEKGYEPLAADFRPGKTRREIRREELRLAAALIGCGLDDLVNRRRTRALQIGAAAACCAAVVGSVVAFQANQLRNAQTTLLEEESERLADQSVALLNRGLRMEAIQVAAAALPQTKDASDRPLVPAAMDALADALGVYPSSGSGGIPESRARYSYRISNKVDDMTVAEDGTWFAVRLADDSMGIFDTLSGEQLAALEGKSSACPTASGNTLILCGGGSCVGYDRLTADARWTLPNGRLNYVRATSMGEGRALVAATTQEGDRSLLTIDAETGKILLESEPINTDSRINDLVVSRDGSQAAALLSTGATIADLTTGEHEFIAVDFGITSGAIDSQLLYLAGVRSDQEGIRTIVCAYDSKTAQMVWSHEKEHSSMPSGAEEVPRVILSGSVLHLVDGMSLTQINSSAGNVIDESNTLEVARFDTAALNEMPIQDVLYQSGIGVTASAGASGTNIASYRLVTPGRVYVSERLVLGDTVYELARFDDGGSTRVGLFPIPSRISNYPGASSLGPGYGTASFPTKNEDGSVVAYCSSAPGQIVVCDFSGRSRPRCHQVDIGASSPSNVRILFLRDVPDSLFACDLGSADSPVAITKVNVHTGSTEGTWTSELKPASSTSAFNPVKLVSAEEGSIIVTGGDFAFMEIVDGHTLETVGNIGTPLPFSGATPVDGSKVDYSLVAWEARDEYLCYETAHGFMQSQRGRFSEADDNITEYDLANPTDPYACVLVSPDESMIFAACSDDAIRCFSTEDGGLLWEYVSGGSSRPLAVSPDGSLLLVEYDGGRLSLIGTEDGAPHSWMEDESGRVFDAEFSADGSAVTVVSYDDDGSFPQSLLLTRYDVTRQEFRRLYSVSQAACDVSEGSQAIIISLETNRQVLYTLPLYTHTELLDIAEEVTRGHELTPEERKLYHLD
ncbi:MAG TPA: TIR domain-containing protein [Candidatus Olsenella excrementigallinarum]|nr:TIR domain-containing protein [Candidatus Olsenella excrementigallinarum]